MEYQLLKYIYRASGKAGAYTLLLLHGTGGDENDLLSIAERFGTDVNLLSVRGNVLEHGMPRFFKRLGMGVFDEQDLEFRTAEMLSFLQDTAQKEQFDLDKMVALGYSNGANMAGSVLLRHPDFLAGAILFRPMQPFKDPGNFRSEKNTPVFMSSGLYDPTVDPLATRKYADALKTGNFEVTAVNMPAGHNLNQDDIDQAKKWFETTFNVENK